MNRTKLGKSAIIAKLMQVYIAVNGRDKLWCSTDLDLFSVYLDQMVVIKPMETSLSWSHDGQEEWKYCGPSLSLAVDSSKQESSSSITCVAIAWSCHRVLIKRKCYKRVVKKALVRKKKLFNVCMGVGVLSSLLNKSSYVYFVEFVFCLSSWTNSACVGGTLSIGILTFRYCFLTNKIFFEENNICKYKLICGCSNRYLRISEYSAVLTD